MKILALFVVVIIMIGCFAACESTGKSDVNEIEKFSAELAGIIKARDALRYLNLLPKPGDKLLNTHARTPSAMPINEEALTKNPTEVTKHFATVLDKIETVLGPVNRSELVKVEYTIDEDPHLKEFGILKFDVKLTLSENSKTVETWQQGCVLSTRGVLTANDLVLEK